MRELVYSSRIAWLTSVLACLMLCANAAADSKQKGKAQKPNPNANVRAINAPNVGQQGSPHQKLPARRLPQQAVGVAAKAVPTLPPRRANNRAPNAGQPGSPIQKLPPRRPVAAVAGNGKAPVVAPRRPRARAADAGQPGSPIQKLPPRRPTPQVANIANPSPQADNALPLRGLQPQRRRGATPGFAGMNTTQTAPKVFAAKLINRFKLSAASRTHRGMEQRGSDWIPAQNRGLLGRFIGGGFNSRVYADRKNKKVVHKLVPLRSFAENSSSIEDLDRENSITDQLGGRAILNKFKQAYQGKGLADMVEVAEMASAPTVWNVVGPNGQTHKFAHTLEQNISSPVFTKNKRGRTVAIKGDNGKFVLATNAYERVMLRAKDRKRQQLKQQGVKVKLNDILAPGSPPSPGKYVLRSRELNDVLTPNEELTINTVLRGLNHNGIVWTDQKLQNLDIVASKTSKTGFKVVMFDFDAFRVAKGGTRQARKAQARNLQTRFDHATHDNGAGVSRAAFDFTAFGGDLPTLASPGANRFRSKLAELDSKTPEQFNVILSRATGGQLKTTSPNL